MLVLAMEFSRDTARTTAGAPWQRNRNSPGHARRADCGDSLEQALGLLPLPDWERSRLTSDRLGVRDLGEPRPTRDSLERR